jgi:hypothetical protein
MRFDSFKLRKKIIECSITLSGLLNGATNLKALSKTWTVDVGANPIITSILSLSSGLRLAAT